MASILGLRKNFDDDRKAFSRVVASELKHIERDVFSAAFAKSFPSGYGQMLTDLFAEAKFLRTGTNITIDLIECEPSRKDQRGEERLEYYQTTSYFMMNVTGSLQMFRPSLFLDRDWDGEKSRLVEWKIGDITLTEAQMVGSEVYSELSNVTDWFKFPIEVPVPPGGKVLVYSKVMNLRYRRDCCTWCGFAPSDSLRFVLNHPSGYRAYVTPKAPASLGHGPFLSDGRRAVVELFTPLLPCATVELAWRPEPPTHLVEAGLSKLAER